MLPGGRYPVLTRDGEHLTLSADGAPYSVHESFLEVSDRKRTRATWSFDPRRTSRADFMELTATVVCPAGRHIDGPAPSHPTCRCQKCGWDYEIET